jgi:hypothetical protein
MKDLQGVDATRNFINQLAQLGVYIFLIYAAYQVFKSVWGCRKKIYSKIRKK